MDMFRIYLSLPTDLHKTIKEKAKSEGLTVTAFIRRELIIICNKAEVK